MRVRPRMPIVRVAQLDQSATVRRWRSQVQFLPWTPFASVPQQPQGEFRKLVFVGASPTRGSSLRLPATARQAISGLWCNSSISRCERDGPGANPGFLTNFSAAHARHRSTTTTHNPESVWQTNLSIKKAPFFEITSKRCKGFPSETRVKRGLRVVHGDKELHEKLGRNDPCPCGSGRSFQKLLPSHRSL